MFERRQFNFILQRIKRLSAQRMAGCAVYCVSVCIIVMMLFLRFVFIFAFSHPPCLCHRNRRRRRHTCYIIAFSFPLIAIVVCCHFQAVGTAACTRSPKIWLWIKMHVKIESWFIPWVQIGLNGATRKDTHRFVTHDGRKCCRKQWQSVSYRIIFVYSKMDERVSHICREREPSIKMAACQNVGIISFCVCVLLLFYARQFVDNDTPSSRVESTRVECHSIEKI